MHFKFLLSFKCPIKAKKKKKRRIIFRPIWGGTASHIRLVGISFYFIHVNFYSVGNGSLQSNSNYVDHTLNQAHAKRLGCWGKGVVFFKEKFLWVWYGFYSLKINVFIFILKTRGHTRTFSTKRKYTHASPFLNYMLSSIPIQYKSFSKRWNSNWY